MVAPTIKSTLDMENNSPTNISEIPSSLAPLVTRIPVDNEISNDGIWLTRPSPMVRIAYLLSASIISRF